VTAEISLARPLSPPARAVVQRLISHGPATREEVGRHLGLSEATMSRAVRALVHDGLVKETPHPTATGGRPRQVMSVVAGSRHVVGIKLTGDRAYGVGCDLQGEVLATSERPLPTPVAGVVPPAAAFAVVRDLVDDLTGRTDRPGGHPRLDSLGISLGGVVARRRDAAQAPFLGWRDVPVADPLAELTGAPVVVSNDVTALAREQQWFGAGRSHETFGMVTVGAGLGFAVVREGVALDQLIDNGHLLAHTPLDPGGPLCGLGHRGCASSYLTREDIARRVSRERGRPVTYRALLSEPDHLVQPWFTDAARALGHLVVTFAGGLQSDRIVLAGEDVGYLLESEVLTATVTERLRDETGGPRCDLELSTEPLTFTDWARGAAVVGIQRLIGAV
jgi:predicted NBD/HSP70 family sugar kinase